MTIQVPAVVFRCAECFKAWTVWDDADEWRHKR